MMDSSRFALLALLFLTACTFSSDEEYFETIDPPDPSKLSIQLSDYNEGDTIRIFQSTTFRYAINTNGGHIKSVRIKVGDEIDYSNSAGTGELYYSSAHHRSGTHVLSIEFTATTGTGSLADTQESEQYTGINKWVLVTDFDLPVAPNIDLKIADGLVRVSWPKYSKHNFKRYRAFRTVDGTTSYGMEIKDPNQNFWVDDGFTGGPKSVRYHVVIENLMGTASAEKSYSHDSNVQFTFNQHDTTVTLKWNKNPFYGAFKEYVIKTLPDVTATIAQIDDTVRTFKLDKLLFGDKARVTFETHAKENGILHNEVYREFTVGDTLPFPGNVYFSAHLNSFILQKASKSLLLLNEELHPTTEIAMNYNIQSLPYPGRYTYSFGTDKMYRTDLVTAETITSMVGATITGHAAAGNGVVAVRSYYRNFGKFFYSTVVYDWSNKKFLFSKGASSTGFNGGINPVILADDGNFFLDVVESKIYNIIPGDTSVLMGNLGTNGKFIGFRKDNSSEFMLEDNNSVAVYSSTTLALLRKIHPPQTNARFAYYDPYTKYMVWSNGDKAYLVHVETGAVRSFQVDFNSGAYFLNGYLIIASTGRYIKVL